MTKKAKIFFFSLTDEMRKEEKLDWFRRTTLDSIEFQNVQPDKNNNWINLADNTDWDTFLPIASKSKTEKNVIFGFSSLGVSTNRDEWVYDFGKQSLKNKIQFFIEKYNHFLNKKDESWDNSIKWSRDLKKKFEQSKSIKFNENLIFLSNYRPFVKQYWFSEKIMNDILTQNHYDIFGEKLTLKSLYIAHIGDVTEKPFTILCGDLAPSLNYLSPASGVRLYPLHKIDSDGKRHDNITDWGLLKFREFYSSNVDTHSSAYLRENEQNTHKNANPHKNEQNTQKNANPHKNDQNVDTHSSAYPRENEQNTQKNAYPHKNEQNTQKNAYPHKNAQNVDTHSSAYPRKNVENEQSIIEKIDIFHYVYAVLHHPAYRQKYELNLKREFPRVPLYENFWQWASWGKMLMDLHINYEQINPYPLQQKEASKFIEKPKAKLKAIKDLGEIVIDENTTLTGVPAQAWEYKLGNRSALEWVLDQYKESKPSDPTIAEKFNTYRFAEYKNHVIDLLKKVCAVSLETMKIIHEMPKE
jgi:predicted helicase